MGDHLVVNIERDANGGKVLWVGLTPEIKNSIIAMTPVWYPEDRFDLKARTDDKVKAKMCERGYTGSGEICLRLTSGPNVGDDVILEARDYCLGKITHNCRNPPHKFEFKRLHRIENPTGKKYLHTIINKISEVARGGDPEQVTQDLQEIQEAFQQLEENYPEILQSHVGDRGAIPRWLEEQFAKQAATAPPPLSEFE